MTYFKIINISWGIIMIGVRLLIHLIPEKWNEFELNKVYTEKKPKWIWAVGVLSIIIVGTTWYKELTTNVNYSILLTLLISITLVKISRILLNYSKFRSFVIKALVGR